MNDDKKFYQDLNYLNVWKPVLDAKAFYQPARKKLKDEIAKKDKVKVLDCGAGTGRGLIKLIEEEIIKVAEVHAFDINGELVADMPRLFQEYAQKKGWSYHSVNSKQKDNFQFKVVDKKKDMDVEVHGFKQSVYELSGIQQELKDIEVVVGQAFIEHVNQGIAYPILNSLIKEGGLIYFYMNCDGWFNYSPSKDRERDEKMVGLFNDLALNNQEFKNDFGAVFGGEAFCGRNLPHRFKNYGIIPLSFGPSDWVVTPYYEEPEEMKFLEYTSTFIREICSSPQAKLMREKWGLEERDVYLWHIEKIDAIKQNEIGFTCVQKDILGRKEK